MTRSRHQEHQEAEWCAEPRRRSERNQVDKVSALGEVHGAYRHMAAGAHFGKIVISIA
jgi:hypothetical protein